MKNHHHHLITYHEDIKKLGDKFKNERAKTYETSEKMQTILDQRTTLEKKKLEDALENYKKKVKQVMESKEMKHYQNEIQQGQKEMSKFLQEAFKYYQNEVGTLNSDTKLTETEKRQKKEELLDYVSSFFLTQEEMEIFTKIVRGGVQVTIL